MGQDSDPDGQHVRIGILTHDGVEASLKEIGNRVEILEARGSFVTIDGLNRLQKLLPKLDTGGEMNPPAVGRVLEIRPHRDDPFIHLPVGDLH